jgi:hypothetical protein
MCRVRSQHTAPPWTTAYICMTLDDSCISEDGTYVDKPMILRMVQWQPFRVKKAFGKKTPVCVTCKKTNRTRSFCRERHQHRDLPWCTVYVMLSTLDSADPSTVVAAPSKPIGATVSSDTEDGIKPSGSQTSQQQSQQDVPEGDGVVKVRSFSESPPLGAKDEVSVAESKTSDLSENISPGDERERLAEVMDSDDINDIAESRTMVIVVSSAGTKITWLECAETDDSTSLRRNLMSDFTETPQQLQYSPRPPSIPPGGHQPVPDQSAYAYPMAYAINAPPQYFQQMQQPMHPPSYPSQAWQYTQVPPPHHPSYGHAAPPFQHHQHLVHHGQVVQHSPGPNNIVPVPDTPVPAPSPAPVTAGEAAAAQRIKNCMQDTDNADAQSPTGPIPPPPLPQLMHVYVPHAVPIHPIPIMTRVSSDVPPHATQPDMSPNPNHHMFPHLQSPTPTPQQPYQSQQQQGHWMMYPPMYQPPLPSQQVPSYPGISTAGPPTMFGSPVAKMGEPPTEDYDISSYHNPSRAASILPPGKSIEQQHPLQEGDENNENSKRPRLG